VKAEGKRQKAQIEIPLAEWVVPRAEKAMPSDYPDEPYLGLDDIEAHTTRLIGSKSSETMKSTAKRFYPGDVLYSRLRPYLNKVWLADSSGLCSAEFIVLPQNDFIDGAFLKYRLNAMDFVGFANSLNAGDRPRVDFDQISAFCLPPFALGYQRNVVARIEELFSELDAGEESLRRARRQLGVYRQSLLKQAFEGKLTAPWRQQNPHLLESPDQLLNRIQEERQARYEERLQEWESAVSLWETREASTRKPSKPRRALDSEPLNNEELHALPRIPKCWKWVRPDALTSFEPYALGIGPFGSNLKVSDYTTSGVPLIFVKNITRNDFKIEPRYVSLTKAEELAAHTAEGGDLLITKMGDPPGDCAIYPNDAPKAVITADCLKFRVLADYCDRSFYAAFINSVSCRKQLGLITRGVAQKKISVERFKSIGIPLCSLPEQQEIVRLLDEQFTVIEQNEREIDAALKRSAALRQSILKKAFTGQLVPQDPTDEPASVLLERIREERQLADHISKRKTARKKAKAI
jgi:type I restriction enzyme S subunit